MMLKMSPLMDMQPKLKLEGTAIKTQMETNQERLRSWGFALRTGHAIGGGGFVALCLVNVGTSRGGRGIKRSSSQVRSKASFGGPNSHHFLN